MLTPTVTQFLSEVSTIIRQRNAPRLCDYLVIEPPYSTIYETLRAEVRASYNAQDGTAAQRLETACTEKLGNVLADPEGNAPTWTAFAKFITQYFIFLRDVDVGNLLATYESLSELLQKANSALSHPASGALLLPTVVSYSRMLSRLAIGLDQQPHLIAHLVRSDGDAESGARETLPERAANILRQAFVTCLNDRAADGAKKRGIYTIANQCLKILFQCRKIRGAAQIFENIYNQSPPLAHYPKSERVTYLYYLGRFAWANGHFFRAQAALQHAWNLCHSGCDKQARLIAIYLVAANLACGRFPSQQMLQRVPELRQRFEPLCLAIRKGDSVSFRRILDPEADSSAFFARYRIGIQLRSRCEILVWRSLVRRAFLFRGDPGNPEARKAPTLDLKVLLVIWQWQEQEYARLTNQDTYIDEDFEEADQFRHTPFDLTHVFSRMSSLIHQDFINGYLSHRMQKLALQGTRTKGTMAGGFPCIWKTVAARCARDEVPGWKLEMRAGMNPGPGQVINLSGARPVGVS